MIFSITIRQISVADIRNLIAQSELASAIEQLSVHTDGKDKALYAELTLHYSRLKQIKRDFRSGIVSLATRNQEFNQIRSALLEITETLS